MLYNKKYFLLLILLGQLLFFPKGYTHSLDYKSNIVPGGAIQEYNISYNIQKAKLLKNYVNSLEKEIQNYEKEHYIQSIALENRSSELKSMSDILKKIQNTQIEKHHAESIIQSIIGKIRVLKQEVSAILKTKLKDSLQMVEFRKIEKTKNATRISKRFISFVNKFTPKVRNLKNSENKKLILSSLTTINTEASKLALFGSKVYNSQKHLDDSYTNSLRSIKRELKTIKAIILNK